MTEFDASQGLPAAFLGVGPPSFVELLKGHAPGLLPGARDDSSPADAPEVGHGTTVLALTFADGVMMAGDRRATSGNVIAQRDLEKVQPADQYSIIAFAGAVGLAADMVRLFQVELEHYEKMNGAVLSLDGKARRLATVLRENLALAMQGLAVVPLFAGYDLTAGTGRIFTFEVVGGPYEARDFYAEGSGSPYARGALKKLYRPGLGLRQAAQVCVEALYDAADDDSATGGPDLTRNIYPTIATATADGYRRLPEEEVRELTQAMVEARRDRPDGPAAPLR
ncbi:MAG TPA: proteasome subunit beta [Streptosporangiaceae bacterium]|nr:proteasome subunit beta [Streptosporangiaceae bacterium]